MSVDIARATPNRLSTLCSLLGHAFVDEPMLRWSMGTHGDIAQRFVQQFELFNETLMEQGMIWEAGTARGAAIWVPSDAGEAYDHAFDSSRAGVGALTEDGGQRWDIFWEWVESKVPEEPLWHLDAVGVAPEWRGTGAGRALIELGLGFARADGVGAWLETGTPGNVPYYECLGFRVAHQLDAPVGGPTIWFMRWDP